jgi:hypothetical protein
MSRSARRAEVRARPERGRFRHDRAPAVSNDCYMHTTTPSKTCVVCGESCDGKPRIKDRKGHYFHQNCYKIAAERCRARRRSVKAQMTTVPPTGVMDEILSASDSHAAMTPCPSCGMAMADDAKLCTRCGVDASDGHRVRTRRDRASHVGSSLPGLSFRSLRTPFGVALCVMVLFCSLVLVSLAVPAVYPIYGGLSFVLSLVLLVGLLIGTFRASLAHFAGLFLITGICMALVMPMDPGPWTFVIGGFGGLYVLYVIFCVCDSQYVRWLFVAQWLSGLFAFLMLRIADS